VIGQGDRLHIIEDNVDNLAITVAKRTQDVVTANAYHKKRSFGGGGWGLMRFRKIVPLVVTVTSWRR